MPQAGEAQVWQAERLVGNEASLPCPRVGELTHELLGSLQEGITNSLACPALLFLRT